ncbi:unnamed protein product [Rotaria socialis]|uniref:Leucine-rich repeat-containing protein 27 n=1 Tax=Rotaria socialis TaxID=392032 RepID=A0A821NZZ3_9BILA|nr:unnamed protein product [Rotaria socialis]CAF4795470.1 unnamed protein product [Rotaria socialis]
MNDFGIPLNLSAAQEQLKNSKIDPILYIDDNKENDLIQFINKAQHQGFNCLDLSKRNIKEFPSQLLGFTSLQYLYLEGNQLTELPDDVFIRLSNLKWLDLRNNKLTLIPSRGLAKHQALQYLLLSGNHLRTLPCELGKMKQLTALNLDGNPLGHPPCYIIKQGIKAIQKCLRDTLESNDLSSSSSSSSSDDDPDQQQQIRSSVHHAPMFLRKSKSETGYYDTTPLNILPAHFQPCLQFKRMTYSALRPSLPSRSRPQSEMRMSQIKPRFVTNKTNEAESDVYFMQEQRLPSKSKPHDTKISEELQQIYHKTYTPTKEFEEPLVHTPFHIDTHFMPILHRNQHDLMKFEGRRIPTPKNPSNEDEQKRLHDQKVQDRIRQITDKMLKRRFEARQSHFAEKRQVKLELRELRRLESATTNPHRPISQMNNHFKKIYDNVNSQKKS